MLGLRILGVFAHPDDEVFCAGGTLARHVHAGAEAMVLCATRGEAGQIRDASIARRSTLGRVREAELGAACEQLGVQHVRVLDHLDGTLATLDRSKLAAEVADAIDEFDPDVVVTFGADGMYGHPDHVAISEAVTESCADRPGVRLCYSHFPRSRLLLVERLATWLTELPARFKGPDEFARMFSLFAHETTAVGYADDHIEIAWFPSGTYIVELGEHGDSLYLILSGEVEVTEDHADGSHRLLRREGPGEFFGELAVARRRPRSANVIAAGPVTCLVFKQRPDTSWAGRGPGSVDHRECATAGLDPIAHDHATTIVDVRSVIDCKMAALAAHRTQYPIDPAMFPHWLLAEMMGHEYFVDRP